jgi:hypothetical protein
VKEICPDVRTLQIVQKIRNENMNCKKEKESENEREE